MDFRSLGPTGIQVSPLCLGAMMFGAIGEPDHDTCIKIIHRALDGGINFIDTADVYSQGESEIIVGKALAGRRDEVILATKFHGQMNRPGDGGTDPNRQGNSRRWIVQEVENSLRRLGTDWIDLYQAHRPDPDIADEETLSALTDLQRQGKIRAFGSSTYPAHAVVQAQWTARAHGLSRYVTEQPPYSILVRGIEADLLPVTQEYGMGVLPWSPLAGGWLSGAYRKGQQLPPSTRAARIPARYDMSIPDNQRKLDATEALACIGRKCRAVVDSSRAGFHASAPRDHQPDHRSAHDAAPGVATRRRGGPIVKRRPGPHRRDRAAWRDDLRHRSGLHATQHCQPVAAATSNRVAEHDGTADE
jgi:aryl-alcohol dehydrogenase-like predicted oxidoreductase